MSCLHWLPCWQPYWQAYEGDKTMKKKLYYDALFTGLVEVTTPVSVPDRPDRVEVTVAKTQKAY